MSTTTSAPPVELPFLDGKPKQLWIGGEWVDAATGRTFASVNPSTGAVIAELAEGDASDADRAVAAAREALRGPWKRMRTAERQRFLRRFADAIEADYAQLRMLEVLDMGSPAGPKPGSGGHKAVEVLHHFAGLAATSYGDTIPNSIRSDVLTYTLHDPVGVVASIIPWNSPISNALWKIAPVLASGCTMVLKPAEEASLVAIRLAELLAGIGLPDGVVNVVTGPGETVGVRLTEHPDVDKVAFTGSTTVGQHIVRAAAGNLKRVTLELGGKSPDIVLADADLSKAVPGAAMGVFANSGQSCCAGTRIFVERPIYDEFLTQVSAFADDLRVGNSVDPSTTIGPVVSAEQLGRVLGYFDIGRDEGARAVAGGRRLVDDDRANGYFVAPTVFADVDDGMRVVTEEIFGPVACVLPFDTLDEVIERSNASTFGLGGGIWTNDLSRAHQLTAELQTGTVWVNTYNMFDPSMPFGGYKMSGWGRECGPNALDAYLNTKAVWIKTD